MDVDCAGFEVETLINIRAARPAQRGRGAELRANRRYGSSSLHAGTDGLRVLRTILAERIRPGPTVLVKSAGQTATNGPPLPTVSVVICAYTEDRWIELEEAIHSVFEQEMRPLEVIVVVDHNPALLSRVAAAHRNVTVRPNHYRNGLSGARNTGLDVATGDVIAFLDDDASARPGWLGLMAEAFVDPAVLSVGGGVRPRWTGTRPAWMPVVLVGGRVQLRGPTRARRTGS